MNERNSQSTISAVLRNAAESLHSVSDSPRLDAELLLQQVLGLERHELICRERETLGKESVADFQKLLARRLAHEPVAYIRGVKEFWGMSFKVGTGVLIPRPATELLVELALGFAEDHKRELSILDLGTGSAAIAVSIASVLKNEDRQFSIVASDKDEKALSYARANIEIYGLQDSIKLRQADWLEGFNPGEDRFDIIVSNPPYIEEDDPNIAPGLGFEPREALFAGSDGLDAVRFLIRAVPAFLKADGVFYCEFGAMQRCEIEAFLKSETELLQKLIWKFHQDLSGLDRALECRLL